MRFSRMLNVVDAHAKGESGKVVVGGVGRSQARRCSTRCSTSQSTTEYPAMSGSNTMCVATVAFGSAGFEKRPVQQPRR